MLTTRITQMTLLERLGIASVILIFTIFLSLLIIGKRDSQGRFETAILINKPIQIVYNTITDHDLNHRWISGIVEQKNLTPQVNGIGSKLLLTEKIHGSTLQMEEEITFLQPPFLKKYTTVGIGAPWKQFIAYNDYELSTQGNQTLFTIRSELEYKGFLYQILEPFITPVVKTKVAEDQKRLKRFLES